MKVLVAGGAGFLGSHLVDKLISEGHEVCIVDSLITGSMKNIEHLRSNPKIEFIEQNVSRPFTTKYEFDYLFHFASPASPVDFDRFPIEVLEVGSLATSLLLNMVKERGAKFFFASTSEVYGDPAFSPQPETYWGNVNPIGPRSVYDEAKRFSEAMTMAYYRTHGLDTHIVRFFNTYGPRMRLDDGRVVPNFIKQALEGNPLTIYGDGQQTRSFGYYADIIDGVYKLAMSDYHLPVNIGTHEERTIKDFAQLVLSLSGSKSETINLPALPDDPKQRRPDLTRANEILNWYPTTSVEVGLELTINWFRNQLQK